jgi:hypothetical protein
MPYTPDASSVTRLHRAHATIPADPEKKSRTFLAVTKDGYQNALLRASDVGQEVYFRQSVLAIPEWKSPQFNGRFFVK